MEILNSIALFIILITIIVFVHEYGHYYLARKYGVGVTSFSIGFGKELFGYTDKFGTRWKFAPFLLGGYVKMYGDENIYSQSKKEEILKKLSSDEKNKILINKPLYQRALIALGGPVANFLLAIFLFTFIFIFSGKDFTQPQVSLVQDKSPAFIAGIKKGDIILEINDNKIIGLNKVSAYINTSLKDNIKFKILRDNDQKYFYIKPIEFKTKDAMGNKIKSKIIGVKISPLNNDLKFEKLGPTMAIYYAIYETLYIIKSSANYFVLLLQGKGDLLQLGGPIKIAKISGQVSEFGFFAFISLMAVISVSLGFINLLPLPVLDGGHLLLIALEKIKGKPLSDNFTNFMFRIGLSIVLFLMIFVMFKDTAELLGFFG